MLDFSRHLSARLPTPGESPTIRAPGSRPAQCSARVGISARTVERSIATDEKRLGCSLNHYGLSEVIGPASIRTSGDSGRLDHLEDHSIRRSSIRKAPSCPREKRELVITSLTRSDAGGPLSTLDLRGSCGPGAPCAGCPRHRRSATC